MSKTITGIYFSFPNSQQFVQDFYFFNFICTVSIEINPRLPPSCPNTVKEINILILIFK